MKVSQDGINLIKKFEGCYLHAYRDQAGILTIGYGHTANVLPNQLITQQQAEQMLKDDLYVFELAVWQSIAPGVTVSQNKFDAMVSLAFNIGPTAFRNSTLIKLFNEGDILGAANQFLVWNKITVKGQKVMLNDLLVRRKKERELFLNSDTYNGGYDGEETPFPQINI